MRSIKHFNDTLATLITASVSNMLFFWIVLVCVILLRFLYPVNMSNLLLNLENDLQLLLLSCGTIVAGKQTAALMRILKHIEKDVDKMEREKELDKSNKSNTAAK